LAASGAKVILEVLPPLRELMAFSFPGIRVVPKSLTLPDFDLQIPLMSLPRIFKTARETIPSDFPYLRADPLRMEKWKPTVEANRQRLNVGLVFGGNLAPDPRR